MARKYLHRNIFNACWRKYLEIREIVEWKKQTLVVGAVTVKICRLQVGITFHALDVGFSNPTVVKFERNSRFQESCISFYRSVLPGEFPLFQGLKPAWDRMRLHSSLESLLGMKFAFALKLSFCFAEQTTK